MKVAYVFALPRSASYKLAQMILPQLEAGTHGVEVVGMFFFDDNTFVLRKGDPIGERLAKVAQEKGMLLMMCDMCALERKLAESDALFEGNPYIGSGLLDFVAEHQTECLSVFLSPLSQEEMVELKVLDLNGTVDSFDLALVLGAWGPCSDIELCVVDEQCDDGLPCNGSETCVVGMCQAGAPVVCDDGNICTNDSCDPRRSARRAR